MSEGTDGRTHQVQLEICDDEVDASESLGALTYGLDVEVTSGPDHPVGGGGWPHYTLRGTPTDLTIVVIRWHAGLTYANATMIGDDLLVDQRHELQNALRTWIGPVGPGVDRSDGYTLSTELFRFAEDLATVAHHLSGPEVTGHEHVQRPDLLKRQLDHVRHALSEVAEEVRRG